MTLKNTEPRLTGQAKYLQIIESLRSDLATGRYPPGARLPSEAELTRKFKVSRMTVVKAMQQLQQEGLLSRRAGSGSFATDAEADHGMVFGLLIPDLGKTEIFEPICRGMVRSPSVKNHSLSWGHALSTTASREEEAEQLCAQYIEQGVAGVFFAPLEFSDAPRTVSSRIVQALTKARVPVVLLDRDYVEYPERSDFDLVGLNNRSAGYVVTDHLIRAGGSRIAFFAKSNSAETVEHRLVGYREALYAHRFPLRRDLVIRGDPSDAGFVKSVLDRTKMDAVMCANDLTAANLMQTLLSLGVRLPQDIRIAGVDDVKYASLLPIPLTTFHQPCAEIGAASMSAMLERVRNPHLPTRSILLDGHLVVRQSCGTQV